MVRRTSSLFGTHRSKKRKARTERERAQARAAGYDSPHQYRKARGAERGFSPTQAAGHARRGETRVSLSARSEANKRTRSLHAIGDQRREPWLTPEQAAAKYGLTADQVRKSVPSAFTSDGELKPNDTATRHINVISGGRVVPVTVRSFRQASIAGEYMNAVKFAMETGDESSLAKFTGKKIAGYELEADLEVLMDMLAAGFLDGIEFYWDRAA